MKKYLSVNSLQLECSTLFVYFKFRISLHFKSCLIVEPCSINILLYFHAMVNFVHYMNMQFISSSTNSLCHTITTNTVHILFTLIIIVIIINIMVLHLTFRNI